MHENRLNWHLKPIRITHPRWMDWQPSRNP